MAYTLENWSFGSNDPHAAPEADPPTLFGEVYGHPRHVDGKEIRTSTIVGIEEEETIVTESGSRYILGKVRPEYEDAFPDAKNRIIKAIREQLG